MAELGICTQIGTVFGFHTERTTFDKENSFHRITNTLNFAGYFPLISIISGIARIYLIVKLIEEDSIPPLVITEISRGCVEILCLGFLFAIPDLIMTIGRECCGYNVIEDD